MTLLIEADDEYLFQAGESAVALKRELVQLVIYQPDNSDPHQPAKK